MVCCCVCGQPQNYASSSTASRSANATSRHIKYNKQLSRPRWLSATKATPQCSPTNGLGKSCSNFFGNSALIAGLLGLIASIITRWVAGRRYHPYRHLATVSIVLSLVMVVFFSGGLIGALQSFIKSQHIAAALRPRNPGWHVVNDTFAGIIYDLPPNWTPIEFKELNIGNSGSAKLILELWRYLPVAVTHSCAERLLVQTSQIHRQIWPESASDILARVATAWWTNSLETGGPTVSTPTTTTPRSSEGVISARADATVQVTPTTRCLSRGGKVAAYALTDGTRAAILCIDLDVDEQAGGPSAPPIQDASQITRIIESVRFMPTA